jgi:hypothetical protein
MKNKGYYGWIHSLNEAAMQSQQNGIDMLAEQAARKGEMLTEAKKPNRTAESIAQQKEYLKNYSTTRAAKKKAADEAKAAVIAANPTGIDDQSDLKVDGLHDTAAIIKAEGMKVGSGVERPESGFHGGNVDDDEYNSTDPHAGVEYIPGNKLPDYGMDAERALTAQLAQQQDRTSKPRDVNQDGIANAQDSVADGADGEIDGLAADAKFMRRRVQPRFAPRTESVSHKISKMLRN